MSDRGYILNGVNADLSVLLNKFCLVQLRGCAKKMLFRHGRECSCLSGKLSTLVNVS